MLDAFIKEHVKVVMVGRPKTATAATGALDAGHVGATAHRERGHRTTSAVDADRIVPADA
jgi:hypothetical protein